MPIRDMLLPEFDQEMVNTRKLLERLPEQIPDYKPHPKSMAFSRLAGHVAELPGWTKETFTKEVLEFDMESFRRRASHVRLTYVIRDSFRSGQGLTCHRNMRTEVKAVGTPDHRAKEDPSEVATINVKCGTYQPDP